MDRLLLDYLPDVLKDIREYRAIMTAEQPELEDGWALAEYALQESVLMTATDYGLKRWEDMIGITPKATETPDERRFRILAFIAGDTPYTYRELERLLANLCGEDGYEIDLDHGAYTLSVKIALTAKNNYDAVQDLLGKTLPANLVLYLDLKYNQHQHLTAARHRDLAAFTHQQLREDALPWQTRRKI